jgi:hypothetical protein
LYPREVRAPDALRKTIAVDAAPGAVVRVTGALSGMLACAVWYAALARDPAIDFRAARLLALGSMVTLSTTAALGLFGLRDSQRARVTAVVALPLELGLVAAWVQATGSGSSYLLALTPLVVLMHRALDGRTLGIAAWVLAGALQLTIAALEHTGTLAYASVYARDAVVAPPSIVAAHAAALLLHAAGLGLGGKLARREGRQRGSHSSSEATPSAGRYAQRTFDGAYRLERLIGRGGMGEVYSATRLGDRLPVAVKVLQAHLTGVPQALDRFRREVELVTQLSCPRICPVLDFGSDAGVSYIVMELLKGEDLGSRLRREGRLPLERVVVIVEQIAEALAAAADKSVVHRDVKPRNIFLVGDRDIDARLLDFGLSRLQDEALDVRASRTGALVGTPGYLAPEQVADGFGPIGAHTDVFALGVVAYRALTGQRAFPSRQPAIAVYEALNHHPAAASTLCPELGAAVDVVLTLALAKPAHQRYASAGDFARDLRAASAGSLPAEVVARARLLLRERDGASATITTAA